jgi:hypothetical protein
MLGIILVLTMPALGYIGQMSTFETMRATNRYLKISIEQRQEPEPSDDDGDDEDDGP